MVMMLQAALVAALYVRDGSETATPTPSAPNAVLVLVVFRVHACTARHHRPHASREQKVGSSGGEARSGEDFRLYKLGQSEAQYTSGMINLSLPQPVKIEYIYDFPTGDRPETKCDQQCDEFGTSSTPVRIRRRTF
jgi:hypothetical protein